MEETQKERGLWKFRLSDIATLLTVLATLCGIISVYFQLDADISMANRSIDKLEERTELLYNSTRDMTEIMAVITADHAWLVKMMSDFKQQLDRLENRVERQNERIGHSTPEK